MDRDAFEHQTRALDGERAEVALDGFRAIGVTGGDAVAWLQDLVTADVERLEPGEAVRTLLLGPTGRVRADLHALRRAEGFLLLQALDQPRDVGALLAPYVLSSDVRLAGAAADELVGIPAIPSWRFGPAGADRICVDAVVVECWRIRRGLPRFPVDLDGESLPAEGGLDDEVTIDRTKGCYLGQESVAKVRNLGHPTRTVLALRAPEAVATGTPILAGDAEVGLATSVDALGGGTDLLGRVRWDARESGLQTPSGTPLARR